MHGAGFLFGAALLGVACVGVVEDGAAGAAPSLPGPDGAAAPGGSGGGGAVPAAEPSRPRAPLRRLSREQYNATVQDLLGDSSRPADSFLVEEIAGSFAGSSTLAQAAPAAIEQYRAAAERLASNAVKNLAALVPCQPQPGAEEDCVRAFLADFGLRALRRPVTSEESAGLLEVYRKVRVEGDFAFGIEALIAALLQSPGFLYRIELAPAGAAPGAVVPLGPYQVSSRLSYFLLGSMPDAELFAAARAGRLATAAEVEAQARRLLGQPRAREAATLFFSQWLSLANLDRQAKDARLFPGFTEGLRAAMREETVRFTRWALFDADGRLDTLLTSPRSMVDATLGKLYGVAAGPDYGLTDLPSDQRSGLLTQASLLTLTAHSDSTSPTRRGKFVLDQLMCQSPPPPPPTSISSCPRPCRVSRRARASWPTPPTPPAPAVTSSSIRSGSASKTTTPSDASRPPRVANRWTPRVRSRGASISTVPSWGRWPWDGSWWPAARCAGASPSSGSASPTAAPTRRATRPRWPWRWTGSPPRAATCAS